MNPFRRQKGFSLVEVLVTLLITTVALLSSASLQLLSKRSNYDAAQRTTAAHLANDLFSRMRSNPNALINYVPGGTIGGGTQGAAPAADCGLPAVICTDAQLAAFDLWQWEQHLDGALEVNNGQMTGGLLTPAACITGPVGGGSGNYQLAIAWRGMTDLSNPTTDNCGVGANDYGAGDKYRRVMLIQTFITAT